MGYSREMPLDQKIGLGATVFIIGTMLLCFVLKCTGGVNWEFSDGSRSGVIQKLSKKGIFWKTWEGELNLGYTEGSTDSNGHQTIRPAMFYFSVSDNAVAEKLKKAEIAGKRVTVDYKQYWLRGYDKGGTAYDVTGVVDASALLTEK